MTGSQKAQQLAGRSYVEQVGWEKPPFRGDSKLLCICACASQQILQVPAAPAHIFMVPLTESDFASAQLVRLLSVSESFPNLIGYKAPIKLYRFRTPIEICDTLSTVL
ncbi:hypothetical protein EYR41_005346 [Orbilia oligospora]|uniref:Uncharacterized protein n=1 Tax=Orbilia oligospora TaxID=2813651 RepID=A0A7C8KCT9_ORBOL|nr:hypothetical protein TWF751_007740 [Orbilia oligospora]TGJ69294.1 hypothetical protein EYR41_005346 [Orbilia oligospora]